MELRPILLNSARCIRDLNKRFGLAIPDFCVNEVLFKVCGFSEPELKELGPTLKNEQWIGWYQNKIKEKELFLIPNKFYFKDRHIRRIEHPLFEMVASYLANENRKDKPVWQTAHGSLNFKNGPLIMGILNVTPDSFSDGGRFYQAEKAVEWALQMVDEGASIIDVGGESTRPGAESIPEEEELKRVIPVIGKLRQKTDVLISIDTYKSRIAEVALQAGADIVNDISGARFDARMIEVVKQYDCPIIIMHIKGTPKNMQQNPYYDDVVAEIYDYFEERIRLLESSGISKIIIDPGIGFGKRLQDNLHLLRDLKDFTFLNKPILMGTSRKSFIGKILRQEVPAKRLFGSLATQIISVQNGADIVRVHDVQATNEALKILAAVKEVEIA